MAGVIEFVDVIDNEPEGVLTFTSGAEKLTRGAAGKLSSNLERRCIQMITQMLAVLKERHAMVQKVRACSPSCNSRDGSPLCFRSLQLM